MYRIDFGMIEFVRLPKVISPLFKLNFEFRRKIPTELSPLIDVNVILPPF